MTIRIMPVGDSNTYGMYKNPSSPGGYRGPLQYMLEGTGADIDFVGLDHDGAIADPDHNGHSGKKIEWFSGPVNKTIYDPNTSVVSHHIDTAGKPAIQHFLDKAVMTAGDVVLLLVGTNNIIAGESAETMLSKVDVLLDQIVSHTSSPEVQLMRLQPVGGDWWEDNDPSRTKNDTINLFNEGLVRLVANKYQSLGVTVVDMNATAADLSTDGVHLTEAGYRKAAGAWYDSLLGDDPVSDATGTTTLNDDSFVRQLYRNVLDREGEQSGVDAWVGGLKGGMSRAEVALGFLESVEHQSKTATFIDDGIWYL
jgi:hypothetical protein